MDIIFKPAPYYEKSLPLPYELLMKIFNDVVRISDHPLLDLCNMAQVSETWQQIILGSPSLWSRFNFNSIPVTDNNLKALAKLIDKLPMIIHHINEFSLKGRINSKDKRSSIFLNDIFSAPNLKELYLDGIESRTKNGTLNQVARTIQQCRKLRILSIRNTKQLSRQQKLLADHLMENGKELEELHLTSSLPAVTTQLFRAIASDFCPRLRVLDISTCDFINTHSFDAIQLTQTMPDLEVLRVANVSFRRVMFAPEVPGLRKLEELSMPIAMRDTERDDALLATLTYGSERITTLDLRGSSITAHALENLPSYNLRELHIDDICPITRRYYVNFIDKWRQSLEVLSLVKINCSETIKRCLFSIVYDNDEDYAIGKARKPIIIREVDLEASDVEPEDLNRFLSKAWTLEALNLTACRSLPRGCKGRYVKNPTSSTVNEGRISDLRKRLGSTHTDSETEIDDVNELSFDCGYGDNRVSRKRKRKRTVHPDYVCDW